MAQLSGVTRVGMIVPSSNTVFEDEVARLVPPGGPVAVHVTRVRVTAISLAADALAQFDTAPMAAAARLLGDAVVGSVAWAGTSGSWLGVDYDRALADALARAAGAPATTSTLALLSACREAGIERIGLVTPYTPDVVARITATLRGAGLSVAAERHSGLTVNHSFAAVGPGEIERMALEAAEAGAGGAGGAQAIAVLCTNLRGGPAGPAITAATGLPVLDSCEVTLAAASAAALPGARQPAHTIGESTT